MDKDDLKMQDDKIQEILSLSKIKAGENLKYRIMQQIETESVLSTKREKVRNLKPLIGNTFLIFGLMYALVVVVALGVFVMGGIEALISLTFFVPVVMISLIFSMFWAISVYDDKRRYKHANHSVQ